MPEGYLKMKRQFIKEGLSEKEAEKKAARIWNSQHPKNPVGSIMLKRNGSIKKIETYSYTYETDHSVGGVIILFENEKFKHVNFPFAGSYTRQQWRILAEIENEIAKIEASYR